MVVLSFVGMLGCTMSMTTGFLIYKFIRLWLIIQKLVKEIPLSRISSE
jgi:hypothetical protein